MSETIKLEKENALNFLQNKKIENPKMVLCRLDISSYDNSLSGVYLTETSGLGDVESFEINNFNNMKEVTDLVKTILNNMDMKLNEEYYVQLKDLKDKALKLNVCKDELVPENSIIETVKNGVKKEDCKVYAMNFSFAHNMILFMTLGKDNDIENVFDFADYHYMLNSNSDLRRLAFESLNNFF